jgi:hypothetical protein
MGCKCRTMYNIAHTTALYCKCKIQENTDTIQLIPHPQNDVIVEHRGMRCVMAPDPVARPRKPYGVKKN